MNLISRLEELEAKAKTHSCKVAQILESLDLDTRKVLERVLESKVSHQTLALELRNSGHDIGRTTIGLHRSGRCTCGGKK